MDIVTQCESGLENEYCEYLNKVYSTVKSVSEKNLLPLFELANRIGRNQDFFYQWSKGTEEPTVKDLYEIAKELKIRVSDLM